MSGYCSMFLYEYDELDGKEIESDWYNGESDTSEEFPEPCKEKEALFQAQRFWSNSPRLQLGRNF